MKISIGRVRELNKLAKKKIAYFFNLSEMDGAMPLAEIRFPRKNEDFDGKIKGVLSAFTDFSNPSYAYPVNECGFFVHKPFSLEAPQKKEKTPKRSR